MKRLLQWIIGALTLGAGFASCSDGDAPQAPPGDSEISGITFSVALPADQATRAIFGDGEQADRLQYALYDAASNRLVEEGETSFGPSNTASLTLQLVNGKMYKVAFFASNSDAADAYTFDAEGHVFKVDYEKMTSYNSIDYDCFFALYEMGSQVEGPMQASVTLSRAVAQLNWGTDDDFTAKAFKEAYGAGGAQLTTEVELKGLYTTFDMLAGEVCGQPVSVIFGAEALPDESIVEYPVEGYRAVSVQTILVPSESTDIIEAKITAYGKGKKTMETSANNLPVQANYRTNVYGTLLTSKTSGGVGIDPGFEGDFNIPIN